MTRLTQACLALITFACCFFPLLSFSQRIEDAYHPPSPYVGLIGLSFSASKGTNTQFTGYWSQRDEYTGKTVIEGNYSNGIPVGLWSSYFPTGRLCHRTWLGDDGFFQNVLYYSDMMPMSIESGRCKFKQGNCLIRFDACTMYDPVGRMVPSSDGPDNPNGMRKELYSRSGSRAETDQSAGIDWRFTVSTDGSFVFHVFLRKQEWFTAQDGKARGGMMTDVVGKYLIDGYLDIPQQRVTIENAFSIAQNSSVDIRFLSRPADESQTIEIDFTSEGAYPYKQTFRCENIDMKKFVKK
jgi:hypothetical protein